MEDEFKILNKPVPFDLSNLGYFTRLKYGLLLLKKQRILNKRGERMEISDFEQELCVFSLTNYTEYFRTVGIHNLTPLINEDNSVMVELNQPYYEVNVRVGKTLADYMNTNKISLKIKDVEGQVCTVFPISCITLTDTRYKLKDQ